MNLVVVSNRLPFAITRGEGGDWKVEPGSGGLVTALRPVLRDRGGRWIGWSGATEEELPDASTLLTGARRRFGYDLIPVSLSAKERDGFYAGFSNEIIWPLFHDLVSTCNFDPSYWSAYESVNRKFADCVTRTVQPDDFIWVHDYHLMRVATELRGQGVTARVAFFLHIPFPPLDIFLKLPWRFEVLHSLLAYDLVGFQTIRDRRNFVQCVRLLLPHVSVSGRGAVWTLTVGEREVRMGSFPISIDVADFEHRGAETAVREKAERIRASEPGRRIVLGIDRLDYTKGIPQKLEAYRNMLRRFPDTRGAVTLIQVLVPSREDIQGYRDHKIAVERLVGEINGEFTRGGWVPIHYIHRSLEGESLPGHYRAADIALVTPLKDGMNLVCKEYCATRVDGDGVLILSEFAGAAAQLQNGAFLVNPFDVEGVANTLYAALQLDPAERRSRMRKLRRILRDHDIYHWLDTFLDAAISKELADFPLVQDYLPVAAGS
jgi:alpha,alpha-trehalose-phosphate synthase [UDP-forming]